MRTSVTGSLKKLAEDHESKSMAGALTTTTVNLPGQNYSSCHCFETVSRARVSDPPVSHEGKTFPTVFGRRRILGDF